MQDYAELFNIRIRQSFGGGGGGALAEWQVNFADTWIYEVLEPRLEAGRGWILAEPELEGKFTKWNNNAGAVRATQSRRGGGGGGGRVGGGGGGLFGLGMGGAIIEEDEEEDEDDDEDDGRALQTHCSQLLREYLW